MLTLQDVTGLLNQYKQRATYTAVAGVVGASPRNVMSRQPKTQRNSWVVAKKTGLPTGFTAAEIHPQLLNRKCVITDPAELLRWLHNPH